MTTAAELDALIEELTVDAYGDEEQLSSFLVGAEEALVPWGTRDDREHAGRGDQRRLRSRRTHGVDGARAA